MAWLFLKEYFSSQQSPRDENPSSAANVLPNYFWTLCSGIAIAESSNSHEFVVMPDQVHLLLAPNSTASLERAMQFIEGGYSHRYMKETGSRVEIWERSFTNHRIHDWVIMTSIGVIFI